jgi:hypothetical protein
MYKRLRIYYLYTALPFAFLLLGAILYRDAIVKTIHSNPHPQINFIIFAIILVGGILILRIIHRLMQEAQQLATFTNAQKSGVSAEELQSIALNSDADIAYVLRMLAASTGRTIRHQEQVAIENEVQKLRERLVTRNALPQFFSGLLVGMGLLGTFIGLLATLDDIATLISSFSNLDIKTADPIAIFGQMVTKMEAPMHSMGVAFSASMYGLMGSIILSFMMVSVRRCMSEINSMLGSEVAQHIEFSFNQQQQSKSTNTTSSSDSVFRLSEGIAEPLNASDLLAYQRANNLSDSEIQALINDENKRVEIARAIDSGKSIENLTLENSLGSIESSSGVNRTLTRIEERLAESLRIQERALSMEIDDFQKQRADMLRVIAEHTSASQEFRIELQRVGRQMGDLLSIADKNSIEIPNHLIEMKILAKDDAMERQRLLSMMVQMQGELLEVVKNQNK